MNTLGLITAGVLYKLFVVILFLAVLSPIMFFGFTLMRKLVHERYKEQFLSLYDRLSKNPIAEAIYWGLVIGLAVLGAFIVLAAAVIVVGIILT